MGQLTDTLRATLRDLAQSDARLYRGLHEELGDASSSTTPPAALLEGGSRASREELEGLSIKVLWELCKARGIKGLSRGPVLKQVEALLSHPDGPPLRNALPVKATKATNKGSKSSKSATGAGKLPAKPAATELQAFERRLDRLEQLVLLIAQQVDVSPEAITQLATPTDLPPI